ncbi:hypothetical protein [Streptomyces virginiae]
MGITEISCRCGDLFEVQPDGSIFKLAEQGSPCEWPVGATLADYVADPECSNCFETLTFRTSSEEIAR